MEITEHLKRLREIPCVVCGRTDITLHHPHGGSIKLAGIYKGVGVKTSDWLCLPICFEHHVGDEGIDHIGVETWERKFGTQFEYLVNLSQELGVNLFQKAGYLAIAGRMGREPHGR